jgi:DNA polymerase-1
MYERRAKNAPIQGSNADITKYALALLYNHLPEYTKLVACVHDEIVLECPEEKAPAVSKLLSAAMHKACKRYLHTVHVPPIDVEIAKYWKKG